ncbi:hypothetical protein C8Q79DRAFT_495719 [Trametes meyenii]|nr:hypothetical protein C8Q79DRAFT_495719 [Trametes meyenii]
MSLDRLPSWRDRTLYVTSLYTHTWHPPVPRPPSDVLRGIPAPSKARLFISKCPAVRRPTALPLPRTIHGKPRSEPHSAILRAGHSRSPSSTYSPLERAFPASPASPLRLRAHTPTAHHRCTLPSLPNIDSASPLPPEGPGVQPYSSTRAPSPSLEPSRRSSTEARRPDSLRGLARILKDNAVLAASSLRARAACSPLQPAPTGRRAMNVAR